MLNHIVLQGRLTRDPELRRTAAGVAVATFTLAVDRDFKTEGGENVDFIDIVAWRSTGEFVSRNFSKGRMATVSGRLQIRTWNDKEGNKRRNAEVIADQVYFGDSKPNSNGGATVPCNSYGNPNGGDYGNYGSGYENNYPILPPDDEGDGLPF
jgi:single-strand DNA-binding protein